MTSKRLVTANYISSKSYMRSCMSSLNYLSQKINPKSQKLCRNSSKSNFILSVSKSTALAVDINCFKFWGEIAFNYLFVCIPKIKNSYFSLQASIN